MIISVVRNVIEQAKKKRQETDQGRGGTREKRDEGRKFPEFPEFPDINDVPGFPRQDYPEERQEREVEKETPQRPAVSEEKGTKAFIDDKMERYRKLQQSEKREPVTKKATKRSKAYSRYPEHDEEPQFSDITREMTSSRKELKKGIIWKEILDKPKFKQNFY